MSHSHSTTHSHHWNSKPLGVLIQNCDPPCDSWHNDCRRQRSIRDITSSRQHYCMSHTAWTSQRGVMIYLLMTIRERQTIQISISCAGIKKWVLLRKLCYPCIGKQSNVTFSVELSGPFSQFLRYETTTSKFFTLPTCYPTPLPHPLPSQKFTSLPWQFTNNFMYSSVRGFKMFLNRHHTLQK